MTSEAKKMTRLVVDSLLVSPPSGESVIKNVSAGWCGVAVWVVE